MQEISPSTPAPQPEKSPHTIRHRILGKLLEVALTPRAVTINNEQPMLNEPPRADIVLSRREGKRWTAEQRKWLPDGVRDRHARHHIFECKFTESLNERSFQQALTYDQHYFLTQRLKEYELQTYVVSAKTPQAALLEELGYRVAEQPGIYVSSYPLLRKVVLIVLNELRNRPHNEMFRLFASRQQVRKTAMNAFTRQPQSAWPEEFWTTLFGLRSFYDLEELAMFPEITIEQVMALGEDIRKKAVAITPPAERLVGLSPEERVAGLAPEERLAGLAPEERLAGLAPEELTALVKQIEIYLHQQPIKKKTHKSKTKP